MKRPPSYATETTVPVERSQAELKQLLEKYGARRHLFFQDESLWNVQFEIENRLYRMTLPRPDEYQDSVLFTPQGMIRSMTRRERELAQLERSLWRSLVLVIKAKLEAAAAGISTVEREFMASVVLPDNELLGDYLQPRIAEAYQTGRKPQMLLPGSLERPSASGTGGRQS